ncbi:MAG: type I-C CRISPR-associated protein Cas8c/Csd1 [Dehalococcoidales bacterium]|nr:type I-C CRISPR-associated protein Cas8c/Csd1 [Dehalococcoidales bacterium]
MLDLLARQAKDSEPGFISKYVRWAIVLHPDKGFLGIQELGDGSKGKNRGREFGKCPDLSQSELVSGPEARSHFLVETASVIALGVLGSDAEIKLKQKHEYFLSILRMAGEAFPEMATIAECLANEEALDRIRISMLEKNVKPNDKVTFQLDEKFIVEEEFWHDWWRNFRKSLANSQKKQKQKSANAMVCFVSGEKVAPTATHFKIKGLAGIGGQPSGDVLVGFDKEAFCSYGLSQSENAAMSEEAMSAYRAGLNYLIEKNSANLVATKVVYWFKKRIEKEDPLEWLVEPSDVVEQNARHQAKKLLESIKTGERPDLGDNEYYVLTLSGAAGRVMVRDWITGPFEELVKNVSQWFDDLEIIALSSGRSVNPFSMERIITCLLPVKKPTQKYKDWIKPVGWERIALLHAAVKGVPLPYSILAKVVLENRSFILTGEMDKLLDNKQETATGLMYSTVYARLALIKAYHIRKYKKEGDENMAKSLTIALNEGFPAPAYQCGRLLAVLAELQRSALGDVGAGIVQRYYAAASTTPALVLGRLTRTSQYHLNKLEPALAWWYEEKISGIWNQLNEAPPRTLTMEEQSLFAMGYYQQLANMRTKTTNEPNKEKNDD